MLARERDFGTIHFVSKDLTMRLAAAPGARDLGGSRAPEPQAASQRPVSGGPARWACPGGAAIASAPQRRPGHERWGVARPPRRLVLSVVALSEMPVTFAPGRASQG